MRHVISAGCAILLYASIGLAQGPVKSVGKWLEVETGKGSVTKWQTSDLTVDPHHPQWLWAIADQNGKAQLPGSTAAIGPAKHVFQIDVPTDDNARSVTARPFEIRFTPEEFNAVKGIIPEAEWRLGLDFEGLVADPKNENTFYTCTEGTTPLLMKLEFNDNQMHVKRVVRISGRTSQDDADDSNINFRWEGLTINSTGTRLFLAAERQTSDNKPRLYTLMVADFDNTPSLVINSHSQVVPKALREVRLPGAQVSALQYVPHFTDQSHPGYLLALNRNPDEKVFIVDLAYLRYEPRVVNLDLYAHGSQGNFKTHGMSPEGLAVDAKTNRVWLINDPVAAYYAVPTGGGDHRFKDQVPMLFALSLKDLVP